MKSGTLEALACSGENAKCEEWDSGDFMLFYRCIDSGVSLLASNLLRCAAAPSMSFTLMSYSPNLYAMPS